VSLYNSLIIKFLAARCLFLMESYIMAPFPEVMLRVRCGWQQSSRTWWAQCRTLENNRSSASSTSSSAVIADAHRPDRAARRIGMSRCAGDQQTSKSPTMLDQRRWASRWRLTGKPAAVWSGTHMQCERRTLMAYMDRAHELMTSSTCSVTDSFSVTVAPSTFSDVTRAIPIQ